MKPYIPVFIFAAVCLSASAFLVGLYATAFYSISAASLGGMVLLSRG